MKIFKTLFFIISFSTFGQKSIWDKTVEASKILDQNAKLSYTLNLKKLKESKFETADSTYGKILHIIGRCYWHLGDPLKGYSFTKNAIVVFSKSNLSPKSKLIAYSYFNKANILFDLQDFNASINDFDHVIKLLTQINKLDEKISECYLMKSFIYHTMGDYSNCILNAENSFKLAQNNLDIALPALISKAQAFIESGKINDAEKILFKVKILSRNIASVPLSNFYFLSGKINFQNKKFDLALKNFKNSIGINKITNDSLNTAEAYLAIADIFRIKRKYSISQNMVDNALSFSNGNRIYELMAHDKRSLIFWQEKEFDKSLKAIQVALRLDEKKLVENPNPKSLIGKANNEILLSLMQHKAETWLAYYHHTHKKEYLQNALETFAVADKMVDYMRREHVGYQSKLFWRDKTHSLYENAIEVCYLLKNYEKAFYFFEKSRAVLLNDKINNLSANQMLSNTDQLKERSFQQEISKLNSEIELETVEAKKSQLNVKMLDIQEAQQKFIKNIAAKYPSYYQFKYDTSMYNLGQLRQYLKKTNTSFIEYFKGDSANYQLVIKSTGVNIIKQKPAENSYQYLINASDLGKRVIVSQDGEFVPLDTLKNAKGEILLNKYAFSNTYSAQYLLRNAEKKVQNGWLNNFIGFAPVNYSKTMALPSLLGADLALANVSGNYFWPKNYEKEQATKANFSQKASNYKIIQLFTHADADNANKEPTIFFADSAMKVSELESFGHFNTELLVLSACKTNVGKVAKGEGTLSMAREFAGLGIPATITTLWSVENEATYQITELFYKYLKEGEPKDVALQKAKLEYLEINSREKQNPKYWAAFVLMGETAPLAGFDGRIVYFGLLILTIIASISFYFFKRNRLVVK
jgi:CHAT domain-containing protein